MRRIWKILGGVACLAVPSAAAAYDESEFGYTVESVTITKPISPGNLSLKNMSSSKSATKRDLAVVGSNPRFIVAGRVLCKAGATLTAVQAIIGNGILHNKEMMVMNDWGKTQKLTNVAGRLVADVSLEVELKVSKRNTDALIDLTFNPAREYEKKLKAFVAKGNTAAEYLRETQAFDMEVPVNLVAWCKMNPNNKSIFAGETHAGFASRKVPVTILYNGDPAIFDGPAARAKSSTRKGSGQPPVKTTPPIE